MGRKEHIIEMAGRKNIDISSLEELDNNFAVLYGEFVDSNRDVGSYISFARQGILVICKDSLIFYGKKNVFNKEDLIHYDYSRLIIKSTRGFLISLLHSDYEVDRYSTISMSLAWEDFIQIDRKKTFFKILGNKIKSSTLEKAVYLLKKGGNNKELEYYIKQILSLGLYSEAFLTLYWHKIQNDAYKQSGGYNNIFEKELLGKQSLFKKHFPNHIEDIDKICQISKLTPGDERFSTDLISDYMDFNQFFKDNNLNFEDLIKIPKVNEYIENNIQQRTKLIKQSLSREFNRQAEELTGQLEQERDIYRDLIKEGFGFKLSCNNNQIDDLLAFYKRNKILETHIPESFTISRLHPQEGFDRLKFILGDLAVDYLKIIDPYLYPDNLEMFFNVPSYIDIKIITYAVNTPKFKSKLNDFEDKIQELRDSRLGKVKVKFIKYKNSNKTPLHDRAIFSRDFGLALSNSLSQIGNRLDLVVRRIFTPAEREITEFDDYWFMQTDIIKKGRNKNKELDIKII